MKRLIPIGLLFFLDSVVFAGCTQSKAKISNQSDRIIDETPDAQKPPENFSGETGIKLTMIENMVEIETKSVTDGKAHFYNATLSNGKAIYFFVVQDKNGVIRVAANACEVCYGAKLGFVQTGDYMKCNNCGNKYPLDKIATEKGGCNPGPINPNLKDENGIITISEKELLEVANLF